MQFSIRAMLGFVSVAALLCCVFFALPNAVSFALLGALAFLVTPAIWISGTIYGHGYGRAFAIGALVPSGVCMLSSFGIAPYMFGYLLDNPDIEVWHFKVPFAVLFASQVVAGISSTTIRWAARRGSDRMALSEPCLQEELVETIESEQLGRLRATPR